MARSRPRFPEGDQLHGWPSSPTRRPPSEKEACPSLPRWPQAEDADCCGKCHRPIRGAAVTAEGRSYHGECFTCDVCSKAVDGSYFLDKAGGLCCARCQEAQAPKCARCGHKVNGKSLTTEEGTFHKECFTCCSCRRCIDGSYRRSDDGILCVSCHESRAPGCGGCGKKVVENRVSANGKTYHAECFACCRCHKQMTGSYFLDDKKTKAGRDALLCEHCHEIKHPPKCCAGCRKRIDGPSVGVDEHSFHKECFTCCQCKHAINGSFLKADGGHLCTGCQPRCTGCKEPMAGSKTIQVNGKEYHASCFKCCACSGTIKGGHYEADRGLHRCEPCHVLKLQAEEDVKESQSIAAQRRLIRRNTEDFKLLWRPELEPCSLQALQEMGVPRQQLPRGKLVSLTFDKKTGQVGCAPLGARTDPRAAMNLSYLASALQVLKRYGGEPCFSLDAKDPHDLSGELLVKRFYPDWLASTVYGEVLFQADYALKELCFGEHAEALPWLKSTFSELENNLKSGKDSACRQWFTIRRAVVFISADGAVVPKVEMKVETRRLVKGKKGMEDAPYTSPDDPMVKQSALVSARFNEVAAHLPVVGELHAMARAMVAARFLLEHGCQCDTSVLEQYVSPLTPEGSRYPMEIPTLRKEQGATKVVQDKKGMGVTLMRRRRAMHGGVDLSVPKAGAGPNAKIETKNDPSHLLAPSTKPMPLPLFLQPGAGRNLKFEA